MSPVLAASLVCSALLCVLAYWVGVSLGPRGQPLRDWISERTRHRHEDRTPRSRPLEDIVADLHRLGGRFHALDPHASYSKVEAVRSGYDRALAECCATLGVTHLLGVIPAGPELDAERARVEAQLAGAGVRLPYAA